VCDDLRLKLSSFLRYVDVYSCLLDLEVVIITVSYLFVIDNNVLCLSTRCFISDNKIGPYRTTATTVDLPLSPSGIIWYWSNLGDALGAEEVAVESSASLSLYRRHLLAVSLTGMI